MTCLSPCLTSIWLGYFFLSNAIMLINVRSSCLQFLVLSTRHSQHRTHKRVWPPSSTGRGVLLLQLTDSPTCTSARSARSRRTGTACSTSRRASSSEYSARLTARRTRSVTSSCASNFFGTFRPVFTILKFCCTDVERVARLALFVLVT